MAIIHQRALLHIAILASCGGVASAFTSTFRSSSIQRPPSFSGVQRQYLKASPINRRQTLVETNLRAKLEDAQIASGSNNMALTKALESNNLEKILSFLQSNASSIPSLSDKQLQNIFYSIELATAESEENTVNKRTLEDANIEDASGVEFQAADRVRTQMTKLYRLLREGGKLNVFGAIGRMPPSSLAATIPPLDGPVYPTSGSKIIPPKLLEKITGIDMMSLTPQQTNFLLYGGGGLAILEGIVSLYFGLNFNLLVFATLTLALMDQILVSGAVFETALRMVKPEMTTRITKHEAGHFLCAYLLGCPVEGVVLSTWAALNDDRFSGRAGGGVSAGTSYYDLDLSEQISGVKPLTRESIDRYSIIVMGGIASEAVEFGRADGGAGDEEALVRFLRSLNPRSGNAVSAWTPELIRNQARWGATQAVLLLKEYKPCYDALVDSLERGGDLGQNIVAIEEAAAREGLGWLRKPFGEVSEVGEFGEWALLDEESAGSSSVEINASVGMSQPNGSSSIENMEETNGVPTYGEDPITSTEEFLKKYRDVMEKKLASIDEKLEEMDNKANDES